MEKISTFYDEYSTRQVRFASNKRHFALTEFIVKKMSGKPVSNLLEIGCGIGAITSIINRKVKPKQIFALDISQKSIEIARNSFNSSNITFFAANFTTDDLNEIQGKKFDVITLFDVLEHIPIDNHIAFFTRIKQYMHKDSLLFINIPSCEHLQYIIKYRPSELQVIDQPLPTSYVINTTSQLNLDLIYFDKHSVWSPLDYTLFIFRLEAEFVEEKIDEKASSILARIKNIFS